jgi:hypothetical protein
MTPQRQVAPVPFTDVFKLRTFWITMAVGIAVNMAWHLYRVWLPRHLDKDLHFNGKQIQQVLMGYYLAADLGSIAFGYLAKRIIGPGRPVERVRKIVVLLAAVVCLMGTPTLFTRDRSFLVPLYFVVEFELQRPRWYWIDDTVVSNSLSYRLSYNALTRQYRLSTGGAFYQNLPTLDEAQRLIALHGVEERAQVHEASSGNVLRYKIQAA